jgi:hypothetical protein
LCEQDRGQTMHMGHECNAKVRALLGYISLRYSLKLRIKRC